MLLPPHLVIPLTTSSPRLVVASAVFPSVGVQLAFLLHSFQATVPALAVGGTTTLSYCAPVVSCATSLFVRVCIRVSESAAAAHRHLQLGRTLHCASYAIANARILLPFCVPVTQWNSLWRTLAVTFTEYLMVPTSFSVATIPAQLYPVHVVTSEVTTEVRATACACAIC